jgi:hypothetical protein
LEISASSRGLPASAWGIWLEAEDSTLWMLVSNESYLSISTDGNPHWMEFFHIYPRANKLYLHVESGNSVTFRVNDEIAWTGALVTGVSWGNVLFRNPDVQWYTISMFAPTP